MCISRRIVLAGTTSLALALGAFARAHDEPVKTPMNMHVDMPSDMQGMAHSMSDHAAMAQRFEAEAARFDREAAEHETMARNYRAGAGTKGNSASLARHCERIAKNLRDSAASAREMSKMQSAETQGSAR